MIKKSRKFPKLKTPHINTKIIRIISFFCIIVVSLTVAFGYYNKTSKLDYQNNDLSKRLENISFDLENAQKDLETLLEDDQIIRNNNLEEEISNIKNTYDSAVSTYESLIDLQDGSKDEYQDLEELFAKALSYLSERNYASASGSLSDLSKKIDKRQEEILITLSTPIPPPQSNAPPNAGYSRQTVKTDIGNFVVSMIAADITSTRILVDTASDSNCENECPVLSLSEYASRNGAFAGVNGTYFCPASYPSCSGKTNSFDLLVMNKNKTYFNSDNNVYSSNPAVIFGENYIRFVSNTSEWGRDTSPNGVISNYPLLIFNSGISFGGDGDPKKGGKGNRSFIASKGNTAYIGVVHSATVAESAHALKSLGMENALNLDSGGSTALWYGGYKAGPGRNIPNAILFTKR